MKTLAITLILLTCIFPQTLSLIGNWELSKVIAEDEIAYDKKDSAITRVGFLKHQAKLYESRKIFGANERSPMSFNDYQRYYGSIRAEFRKNASCDFSFPGYPESSMVYKYLPERNMLILSQGTGSDSVKIQLTDSSFSLELGEKSLRTLLIYSRVR
jgi:hypothetical protein